MAEQVGFLGQVRNFPANFWCANTIEMLERLAFFSVQAVRALFLVAAAEQGGLGLTYTDKGNILALWALVQCLVPMVSGGYSDRYGYPRSLFVAFTLNIIGYALMGESKALADDFCAQGWSTAGYWIFLAASMFVATGTAIFKPPIHGTVARSVNDATSSMGFGIFYWVVNVGGFVGPVMAAQIRGETNWRYVFYAVAGFTALNFLVMLLFYREPDKGPVDRSKGPVATFASSLGHIFTDLRLVLFLLIFSCFWLMFMQLWDLLPNFISEWINTADVAPVFGAINSKWVLASGQTKPEMIINIDSAAIILLVLGISFLISKLHKVAAMILGMCIALVGFVGAGLTNVGLVCCLMIFVFSIGEMVCCPTFSAYVGLIAPPDKKALYMGYSNIPFAIGWSVGNKISGPLYERLSSKYDLARQYLVEQLGVDPAVALDKAKMTNDQVMDALAASLHGGTGGTLAEATRLLWDLHHPYMVWYYLGAIGLIGTVGMAIFYLVARPPRSAEGPTDTKQA